MKRYDSETRIEGEYFGQPITHAVSKGCAHEVVDAPDATMALKAKMYAEASIRKRAYIVKVVASQG